MARRISTKWTFFFKYIFPVTILTIFTIQTGLMYCCPDQVRLRGHSDILEVRQGFALALLFAAGFLYWPCMRLKRVRIAGHELLVSNYLKEIHVPLSQVEKISGSDSWLGSGHLKIHFSQPTEFGRSIVFMPTERWFPCYFTEHPVVAELEELVQTARKERVSR